MIKPRMTATKLPDQTPIKGDIRPCAISKMIPRYKHEVVAPDQDERQDQSACATAPPRPHAHRHAKQRENQACSGKRDAPLKLDSRGAPSRPLVVQEKVLAGCSPATESALSFVGKVAPGGYRRE